jgi:uncharacterized Ntn-hydrolase superfamily protein
MATATKATKKTAKRVMSDDHKAKLAQGRNESRVVSRYLDAVSAGKGKRGRKRTPQSIAAQITRIEEEIDNATPIKKLELIQRRADLEAERARLETRTDIEALEKNFVKVAKSYATRNGISYSSFRTLGVSADVLKKAGVPRTRG